MSNEHSLVNQFVTAMKIRNYSPRTIKSYTRILELYIDYSRKHSDIEPGKRILDFLIRWEQHPATVKQSYAVLKAGLSGRITCHCLRHSLATHLLEAGVDVKSIKELLGHSNVQTTMVYLHVAQMRQIRVRSPL
ncbi:tyrosine-type recombinase/integrase [Oceanispirochaeta sp.]|jgi:site-specific recombinase XerD|uniref:tyrosine-type recombinase/integrase n=1 Tax=Oceanispirochaeta sp. TaxID=2035350 RepID=UPI00260D0EDF|nr:tyrosine-type recombinase/integrase [Oceanispirochaeta sp.]MDA3956115.1 tyrosine-type recombinase/integrase [Oceanispirochaeta sp.]